MFLIAVFGSVRCLEATTKIHHFRPNSSICLPTEGNSTQCSRLLHSRVLIHNVDKRRGWVITMYTYPLTSLCLIGIVSLWWSFMLNSKLETPPQITCTFSS